MITYDVVAVRGGLLRKLTGLTPAQYAELYAGLVVTQRERREHSVFTKRTGSVRKRAPGGGRRHKLDGPTRLLMCLFWLRVYPTFEVLGFLFGLDPAQAFRNVQEVLSDLESMTDLPLDRPDRLGAGRTPLTSQEAVMEAFPEVALVIDAKEQRVRRPRDYDTQKRYYSGKKRAHTLKNEIDVDPSGRIAYVSETVPGTVHDLTLHRGIRVLDRLEDGRGAMADEGYQGLRNDYPDRPIHLPHRKRNGLSPPMKQENRLLNRYRVIVEHVICQMNKYQALAQTYRNQPKTHPIVIRVVAGLVNRRTQTTPLRVCQAAI
jgi:hypothetical protein